MITITTKKNDIEFKLWCNNLKRVGINVIAIDNTCKLHEINIELEEILKKLSLKSQKYTGIRIEEEKDGVIFKYITGSFENDFESANALKNEMRKKGFSAAFVFATENGVRIPLNQAINKIIKK